MGDVSSPDAGYPSMGWLYQWCTHTVQNMKSLVNLMWKRTLKQKAQALAMHNRRLTIMMTAGAKRMY